MELLLTVYSTAYGTIQLMVKFWIELVLLPFKLPLSGLCLWLSALRWCVQRLPLLGDYLFDKGEPQHKSRSPSLEELVNEKRDFRKRAHSFCNCDVIKTGKRNTSTRQKNLTNLRKMLIENKMKSHGSHLVFPDQYGSYSAGPSPKLHRRLKRHSMQEDLSNIPPRLSVPKDPQVDQTLFLDKDPRGGDLSMQEPQSPSSPPTSDTELEAEPPYNGRIPRHSSPDIYRIRHKSGENSPKYWKEGTTTHLSPQGNDQTPIVDEANTEQLEEEKAILQLRLAEAERKNEALGEALLEHRHTTPPTDYTLPEMDDSFYKALDDNMNAEEYLRLTASTEYEMATC